MKNIAIILDISKVNDMKSYVNKTPKCLFEILDKTILDMVSENVNCSSFDDIIYILNESDFSNVSNHLKNQKIYMIKDNQNIFDFIKDNCSLSDYDNILFIDYCLPLLTSKSIDEILKNHISNSFDLSCFEGLYLIRNDKIIKNSTFELLKDKLQKVCLIDIISNEETRIINNRINLEFAIQITRSRINQKHMLNGVTIVDSKTTYIGNNVRIGNDTIIYPNTHIYGNSMIGIGCELGPNSYIIDSFIDNGANIANSIVKNQSIKNIK